MTRKGSFFVTVYMKKAIVTAVTAMLLLSSTMGLTEGDYSIKRYPGQREYYSKYRNINFSDIRGDWSQEAVYTIGALGIAKGVSSQSFNPRGTLTTEQSLLFLIRMMGKEEEAQRLGLSLFQNRDTGGSYSPSNYHITIMGAIAVAENMGMIDQEDIQNIAPLTVAQERRIDREVDGELQNYRRLGLSDQQLENIRESLKEEKERAHRWQRPASRELVAYLLGKAISETGGIAGDGQQVIDTFEDSKSIDGRYAPYVEEVLQRGLMRGSTGNRFNPKSTITRAEMAQIIYNGHEEQLQRQGYLIEQGKIIDIRVEKGSDGSEPVRRRIIKVQTEDNDIIEFYGQISENGNAKYEKGTITYIDGLLRDHQILREGQYIQYYVKPSGEVVFVRQLSNQLRNVDGKVIGLYDQMILIEDVSGNLHRYQLSNEVDFKVNGKWTEMNSLTSGMRVELSILNGKVSAISGRAQEGGIGGGGNIAIGDYFHTGTVVSARNNSKQLIIAKDKLGQNIETLNLESYPNIPVYRDGARIPFTSIRSGDFVRIYYSDLQGNIEKIELKSFRTRSVEGIYKGTISNYNRNRNQITIDYGSRVNGVSNWESLSGERTMQISDNADMYVTDSGGSTDILISRDAFEDYGNYKEQKAQYIQYALNNGQSIYLYTEAINGQEEITRIILREVGEYRFSGVLESLSNGVIAMPSNQNIYYNNSTIVLKEGRLVQPSSLSEGDTLTVYTHDGRNTAAIIIVEGEDVSDYPYTVYSTRLTGVNVTRQQLEVSGTGSQKVRGTNVNPFPLETLNLPTDAVIQVIKAGSGSKNIRNISAREFLNRYYAEYEYANVKVVTDDFQNILMLQIYDEELNRPSLTDIRVGKVMFKKLDEREQEDDISFGDVGMGEVRTWTGSNWSTGIDQIKLNFQEAIVISNGRVVGLDRVRDGSNIYVVGDVNTGHVLIVR